MTTINYDLQYQHLVAETLDALKAMGADHAEVKLVESDDFEVYGTAGKLNLVRSIENVTLAVAVHKDQKCATTSMNDMSADSREAALKALMVSVAEAEPDSAYEFSQVAEPQILVIGPQPFDQDGLECIDTLYSELSGQLAGFVTDTKREFPEIMLAEFGGQYNYRKILLHNTKGTQLLERRGAFEIFSLFNAVDESKSSSFNYAVTCPPKLGAPLIENPYWYESLSRNAQELNPVAFEGRLEGNVVFSPACFVDLLMAIEGLALCDNAFIKNFSKWKEMQGKLVCDPKLTWRCEPTAPHVGAGFGITSDGFPAQDTTVIEKGVLNTFMLSLYAANKTGQERSKNQGGLYWIEPGDQPLETMLSGIDRGIFISRISGGEPSPNGDYSGIAKNSFMIENGRITHAITEAMATMNIFEVMADMAGLSAETHNSGTFNAPYLHSHKVLVTGK